MHLLSTIYADCGGICNEGKREPGDLGKLFFFFFLPESDLECGSLLGQKWHGTCCSSLPLWHLQRFSSLCFIYRTCRGPTCPPGNPRCAPHQRISPLPPQLHRVASLVCFAHKVDSFDSWLLPVHYSCQSAPWFFFFFFFFTSRGTLTSISSSASPNHLLTIQAECHVWVTTCLSI